MKTWALEDTELELSWLHTKGNGLQSDIGTAEFQKGFGLLTMQVQVPYGRNFSPDEISKGFGNVDFGARYPLYQFVSPNRMVDTTFGAALEGGFPVHYSFSRNADIEPEVFNELKLGELLSPFKPSSAIPRFSAAATTEAKHTLFDYGLNFSWIFPHRQVPFLPAVQQLIPMFELVGETGINGDEAGQNSLMGDIGFRAKFNPHRRRATRPRLRLYFPDRPWRETGNELGIYYQPDLRVLDRNSFSRGQKMQPAFCHRTPVDPFEGLGVERELRAVAF